MKTTGRSSVGIRSVSPYRSSRSAGILRFKMSIILPIAPVAPDPQNSTTSSSVAPIESAMICRASSRNRVVCNPVPDVSVCVFA